MPWLLGALLMVLGTEASAGVAVEGFDRLNLAASPPLVSLELLSYENVGYRLDLQGSGGRVEVDLSPLGSKALFSLPSPALARGDEVTRLARAVVAGAETQYEASSRLLGWVSQNIRYHLDRSEAQAAPAVLRRRSAYCSGLARLSVALHRAVGLESREVPGLVLEASGAVKPHRWLEVRMADLGWVFSDPLSSHHFVPATYLPLASSRLPANCG